MVKRVSLKYKPAPTNEKKNLVAGGFKNSGQKEGKKTLNRKEKARSIDPVQAKLRKISKSLFFRKRAMNDATMRAQLNA